MTAKEALKYIKETCVDSYESYKVANPRELRPPSERDLKFPEEKRAKGYHVSKYNMER